MLDLDFFFYGDFVFDMLWLMLLYLCLGECVFVLWLLFEIVFDFVLLVLGEGW